MQTQVVGIFAKMLGTAAVILLVAAFVAGGPILKQARGRSKKKYVVISGIIGGLFGIYGNLSGVPFGGAIISVRDIGPMLSGFVGGPVAGLLSGVIAGLHRLTLGGISAKPCIVATCIIGTLCGLISLRDKERLVKPHVAFITGVLMELMHLGILLIMVKPFEAGLEIVKGIAVPFVIANATGFTLMIGIMSFIEKQSELVADKSRLESELSVAEKIQRSMLPVLNDSFPGREEISVAASMEPAKVVGGDFFDLFFIDNDKLVFLIADVAGKGVPGALFMMNAKQILKEKILSSESLAEAVTLANNDLCLRNEAEMFVTSWLGVLDLATGHVDYINAGHNPPVICEGGDAEYLISRSGLVLAGMEGVPYRQNEFEMKQGTMIFLYTDGVTEAENENYDQFGEDALLENINEVRDEDPEKIVEHIRGKLTEHADGCEQSDDITMLCIKYGQSN